jgi:hypothetical protein
MGAGPYHLSPLTCPVALTNGMSNWGSTLSDHTTDPERTRQSCSTRTSSAHRTDTPGYRRGTQRHASISRGGVAADHGWSAPRPRRPRLAETRPAALASADASRQPRLAQRDGRRSCFAQALKWQQNRFQQQAAVVSGLGSSLGEGHRKGEPALVTSHLDAVSNRLAATVLLC